MRGLLRRVIEFVRTTRLDRETIEELSHHVELLVEWKMASGLDEVEARRQAGVEAGSVLSVREQVAEGRTGFVLDQLARDVRYAARTLKRSPGVTLLSVATMGVGIGASAVLFTLINGIVLRPLPYPEPDRLVRLFDTNPAAGIDRIGIATGNIDDWRRRAGAFDGIAGYYVMGRTASFDSDADVLLTAQVSQDFFELLRVNPIVGRSFTPEETDRAEFNAANAPTGADPVVLLSYGVWIQRFGGDRNVVGRTIVLERRSFKIVGVMPKGFAMPDAAVQLWTPWSVSKDRARDQHYLSGVARLKAGVSTKEAEDRLNSVARALGDEYPATNRGWGVRLSPLARESVGDTAEILWILFAAVGLVLLVACANITLLSLMRRLDRRQETAVRVALGASSTRLAREFLLESVLLALLGGVVGAAIAVGGLRLLPALTSDLPRLNEVAFGARTVAFIAAMTSLCALLSGLPQAWRRIDVRPVAGLSSGTLRVTEGIDRHWLRGGMVVAQIAMAVILMTSAGLLVRSFTRLRAADPGFNPHGVLVAPIFLDAQAYGSGAKARAYYRTLFDRLSLIPGVTAVGGATTLPTSPLGPDFERPVWPEGSAPDGANHAPATVRIVTPGYFKVLGLRVVEGRSIDDRDSTQAPRVLMVSEALARRMWPGQDALGKPLVVDYSTAGTYPYEIIGVVGDLRFHGPRSEPLPEIYLSHAQRSYLILNVAVKAAGDPRALVAPVRAVLKEIDPLKPAQGLYPLDDLVAATYARDRQVMITLLIFASAAIFLAVLSIYGILSQRVRERSREIGIRMALGANTPSVIGWVAGSGLRLITLGLASGAVAARALSGVLGGLLFGVAPTDVVTTLGVAGTLAGVGAIAMLAPAWRATRIDPIQILRRG